MTRPAPTDETAAVLCWMRIDGRDYALSEGDAWKIAWELIGICVDRKAARREARDDG